MQALRLALCLSMLRRCNSLPDLWSGAVRLLPLCPLLTDWWIRIKAAAQVLSIYPSTIRRRILRHLYLRALRKCYLFKVTVILSASAQRNLLITASTACQTGP